MPYDHSRASGRGRRGDPTRFGAASIGGLFAPSTTTRPSVVGPGTGIRYFDVPLYGYGTASAGSGGLRPAARRVRPVGRTPGRPRIPRRRHRPRRSTVGTTPTTASATGGSSSTTAEGVTARSRRASSGSATGSTRLHPRSRRPLAGRDRRRLSGAASAARAGRRRAIGVGIKQSAMLAGSPVRRRWTRSSCRAVHLLDQDALRSSCRCASSAGSPCLSEAS